MKRAEVIKPQPKDHLDQFILCPKNYPEIVVEYTPAAVTVNVTVQV